MRKILIAIIAFFAFVPAAVAADNAPVGVVDVPRIITQCEPGKQVRANLEKTFAGTKADLEAQKKDLEKLRDEMQKQSLVLSQEAKVDKEVEFKRKVRDYQDSMRDFQRKAKAEEARLAEPVVKLIREALVKYGKDKGYAMIFDAKGSVLYADAKNDITDEIITVVNMAWKAGQKK